MVMVLKIQKRDRYLFNCLFHKNFRAGAGEVRPMKPQGNGTGAYPVDEGNF
jgi:hypothetical protein